MNYSYNMQPYSVIFENIFTQNLIVFGVLGLIFLLSFRKKTDNKGLIPILTSQELKWLAILTIVFIHISYSLVNNWQFLHPLAAFAWVGVDIFLFLSGYWLAISAIKKPIGILNFYKKRLFKVFLPFWIVIIFLFLADFFLLRKTYSFEIILQNFLIFFPTADIWNDFNSPFWYLTWLLFFYLAFPLVFRAHSPILSAIFLYSIALNFVKINPLQMDTNWLHALHLLAFPMGIIIASQEGKIQNFFHQKIFSKKFLSPIFCLFFVIFFIIIWNIEIKNFEIFYDFFHRFGDAPKIIEQIKSIFLLFLVTLIFIFLPFSNKFLWILGLFSYEIYLLHWPLMARYDVIFHNLPIGIATIIWIFLLILIAFLFQKMMKFFEKKFSKIFQKSS